MSKTTKIRENCRFDHSASKTPEEAARWCQMFHSPEAQDRVEDSELEAARPDWDPYWDEEEADDRPRTYHSDALGAVTIPEDDQ